jgi:polysaccharide export outer membrane protein
LKDGDLYQDVILQAGDTVTIPTATQLSPAETTELASASFSPDSIRVNVVGEVKQPGTVQIPPNSTLNQAILAAGGFDLKRANTRIVELIRLNSDGTVSKQQIPINFAQGINDKTNPSLHNNDIVVIGRSGLAKFSDGLSSVLAPVNTLPVFSILNLVGL